MRLEYQILLKSPPPKFTDWIGPWAGAHYYWYFSDFSWFVRLHTLGTTVQQFAYCYIASFLQPYGSHLPIAPMLTTRIIASLRFLTSLGYHKGESDRKLLCWEIDFAPATHLQSSKFVSKSLHVKWRKRLKQDQRKCADYNNRSLNLLPPKPDIIVAYLARRRRPVCKRCACLVLTTQYTLHSAVSAHNSSEYAKTLFRNWHPSNIINIRTRASV